MARNEPFAAAFADGDLAAPPRRGLAVLTCMDARVVPHKFLDLDIGDMHVIRNGGARATPDAIRSLTLSTRLLEVWQIAVIHHTDCGNRGTDDELADKLRDAGLANPPSPLHANRDPEGAVRDDVAALRATPYIADSVQINGYLYDVTTGRLRIVD